MKTMKKLTIGLFALLMSPSLLAQEVRIYNWSDYIDPDLIAEFTEETGIKVIYDTFDSNEVLLAKILTGNSGYDIVVPSDYTVKYLVDAKQLLPIDQTKIPNYKNIWSFVTHQLNNLEGVNQYSVPYFWGTTGIAYDANKVKALLPNAPLDSMDLLFDPENAKALASCGIYLLDSPSEMYPMVLTYLGLDPEATDSESITKANGVLETIRPYVKKFHSSEYINALANGDACIAMGWSGDIYMAKSRATETNSNIKIEYMIPKEGAYLWFDQFAIIKDSKNVDEAYQFINYMLDPKVNARAADYVEYATSNEAAFEYIDQDLRQDETLYPSTDSLEKLHVKQPYTQREQRQLMNRFIHLKSMK